MRVVADLIASLECADLGVYLDAVRSGNRPRGQIWTVTNEVRPVDLYCYLWARFGPPNGVYNLLRANDSENLVHWDWTLSCRYGWVLFLGMSFRTEIHFMGAFPLSQSEKDEFLDEIKRDFRNYGPRMSEVRDTQLEKWVEFVNPYQRLKQAVDQLLKDLEALALDAEKDVVWNALDQLDRNDSLREWNDLAQRYSRGLGLCFGIRAMLRVMAEAFINLVLFALMKPEIKGDSRLREHELREQIDIRIKRLSMTGIGFEKSIDYSSKPCRDHHSFVNERNDLLHGNVVIDKLRFSDVFFDGRVPVFEEYRSMWQRSIGVGAYAVGLEKVNEEVRIVEDFIQYILSCLYDDVRWQVEMIAEKLHLGYMPKTQRLGILFPDHLVDWRVSGQSEAQ